MCACSLLSFMEWVGVAEVVDPAIETYLRGKGNIFIRTMRFLLAKQQENPDLPLNSDKCLKDLIGHSEDLKLQLGRMSLVLRWKRPFYLFYEAEECLLTPDILVRGFDDLINIQLSLQNRSTDEACVSKARREYLGLEAKLEEINEREFNYLTSNESTIVEKENVEVLDRPFLTPSVLPSSSSSTPRPESIELASTAFEPPSFQGSISRRMLGSGPLRSAKENAQGDERNTWREGDEANSDVDEDLYSRYIQAKQVYLKAVAATKGVGVRQYAKQYWRLLDYIGMPTPGPWKCPLCSRLLPWIEDMTANICGPCGMRRPMGSAEAVRLLLQEECQELASLVSAYISIVTRVQKRSSPVSDACTGQFSTAREVLYLLLGLALSFGLAYWVVNKLIS
jgi:hypothetical protein